MKKAVFVSRSCLLNVTYHRNAPVMPKTVSECQMRDGAKESLAALKQQGFIVIFIGNEPGLSNGSTLRRELEAMNDWLRRKFPCDDILVCPHEETAHCPCLPPRPGLLIEAAFKWNLNLDNSWVIGETHREIEAARTAGCSFVTLNGPCAKKFSHNALRNIVDNINEGLKRITQSSRKQPVC
jgi:D-glycero-D-manno-heptose 1,7-bisphosphate phosphatase